MDSNVSIEEKTKGHFIIPDLNAVIGMWSRKLRDTLLPKDLATVQFLDQKKLLMSLTMLNVLHNLRPTQHILIVQFLMHHLAFTSLPL
jgi:hypothetical protein